MRKWEKKINMAVTKISLMTEMDRTGSVSCSVVGFGISGVEQSGCIITVSHLAFSFCTVYESMFSCH
jgi:hypothetical protein